MIKDKPESNQELLHLLTRNEQMHSKWKRPSHVAGMWVLHNENQLTQFAWI